MKCKICKEEAVVGLRSHNAAFCEGCYKKFFRRQIERGVASLKLIRPQDKILVALSGGKDSLALMLELTEMGYNATGLFVDLAIPDSSNVARAKVQQFCAIHRLPLRVVDLREEGLAIPLVKNVTARPICSVCGTIKRYYFNRIAIQGGFDALATGHNLDDETARLFSNTLRWDKAYLADQGPLLPASPGFVRKIKPLWRLTEFETANYAFLRHIPHHHAPCPYSSGASFTTLKGVLQVLEEKMPGRKLDFYQGFLARGRQCFAREEESLRPCVRCGSPTSAPVCGVCRLREAVAQGQSNHTENPPCGCSR